MIPVRRDGLGETEIPTVDQLRLELGREKTKERWSRTTGRIAGAVIVAAAVIGLVTMLFFPVFKIKGDSMSGTMNDGDISVAFNAPRYGTGDVVAFFHGRDILIRRIIATAGQTVSVDADGTVTVDGEPIDEPYAEGNPVGTGDVVFPCQVPEGTYFVMGDKRDSSIDSRNSEIGFVRDDDVIGKLFLKAWPIKAVGIIR